MEYCFVCIELHCIEWLPVQRPIYNFHLHLLGLDLFPLGKIPSIVQKGWTFSPSASAQCDHCVLLRKVIHTQLSFTFSSCKKELKTATSTTVWFLCNDKSFVWSSSLWSLAKFTNTWENTKWASIRSSSQGDVDSSLSSIVTGVNISQQRTNQGTVFPRK